MNAFPFRTIRRILERNARNGGRASTLATAILGAARALVGKFRLDKEIACIRNSPLFDADWYLAENPDVKAAGLDPALHYLKTGGFGGRDPSPAFCNGEYLALNGEVRFLGINPLLHYERFGRKERRPLSDADVAPAVFPEGTVEIRRDFAVSPGKTGRTAVFAVYSGDGRIPAKDLLYLEGLKTVADNIVVVGDCPVFPEETEKLEGLAAIAVFARHGGYDFGSYARGFALAEEAGLLERTEELVLANDSCFAPVFPFSEAFAEMGRRSCDFWGMTQHRVKNLVHLQSFFYVFRGRELIRGPVREFLAGAIGRIPDRGAAIVRGELAFTAFLAGLGHSFDSYLPKDVLEGNPMKHPLVAMRRYRLPLVKSKILGAVSADPPGKTVRFAEKANPALGTLMRRRYEMERALPAAPRRVPPVLERHRADMPRKVAEWRKAARRGERLKTVFFASSAPAFAAASLFDAMMRDSLFDPYVCVVPDRRFRGELPARMEETEAEMRVRFGDGRVLCVRGEEGIWPDATEGAALAVHSMPPPDTVYRYAPRHAVGHGFLSVGIHPGGCFAPADLDALSRQDYAWMWKVFFACKADAEEYAARSILKGANMELAGCIRLDGLARRPAAPRSPRKRVLLVPSHAVAGKADADAAVPDADFERHAGLFADLPARHPETDFVFRPSPLLFADLARPGKWGGERVSRFIEALKAHPNVVWAEGGDGLWNLAAADACILEPGPHVLDSLLADKPCCCLLGPSADDDDALTQFGRDCLACCRIARGADGLDAFVREVVLGEPDPLAGERKAFAATAVANPLHAADAALGLIKKAILG